MQVVFPIAETALQSVHHCQVHQEDNWIIYTCKQCPSYERKIDRNTGQVFMKGQSSFSIDHVCDRGHR